MNIMSLTQLKWLKYLMLYMIINQIKSYFIYQSLHLLLQVGVTASFGMLGDIIIAKPNSYIAFVGKRVIEKKNEKYST